MNNVKKSKLNMVISLLYQLVAIALGLLIPRMTMVVYGSEVNGLLSSVLQFIGYLSLLEAGIQAVAMKSMFKTVATEDHEGTNAILSAVNTNYRKIGIYYLLGLIILAAVYPFIIKEDLNYITVFLVVLFSGLSNVALFFFQGKYRILLLVDGKQYYIGIVNIITTILSHGVKILLIYLECSIAMIVFGTFVASLIPVVAIMICIRKSYKWINLKAEPNFGALEQSKDAIIHQIAYVIFSGTDVLFLTVFCDLKVVSVYVIYKMINDYIFAFSKIPLDSISFRLGQIFNVDKERFKKCICPVELFTSNVSFILFTVTLCLSTSFVGLYSTGIYDINYVDPVLAILFVLCQLLDCMRRPMLNTINYAGHFKQTLKPTIFETIINLVASILGIAFLGIYGVLLGTIFALLYRTIDIIVYANKKLLNRSPYRNFLYYVIELFVLAIIYVSFINLNIDIGSYFEFIIVGFVLTLCTAVIFITISCIVFKKEARFLYSYLKKDK